MPFRQDLDTFIGQLDPTEHTDIIEVLKRCRTFADLDRMAQGEAWLTPERDGKRPRLVKHGNGTFMVVEYDDGWTKRLATHPIGR